MHSSHAALPRSVGPYTVVRTTKLLTSSSPFLIFGSFATQGIEIEEPPGDLSIGSGYGMKHWTNICCMGAPDNISTSSFDTAPISGGNHTSLYTVPLPGLNGNGVFGDQSTGTIRSQHSNTTAVPSAITVQVINPNAVQSAAGTAVAAVCPVRLDLCNSTKSWGQVADELLSYYRPRVLAGGKLALRGVQMDSHPLSMTDVSDFRELWEVDPLITAPSTLVWNSQREQQNIVNPGAFSPAQTTFRCEPRPEGWAPMVYYNPYNAAKGPSERQEMSFLVTVEWRVRFDISNPACSSHSLHKPTTDVQWHSHMKKAVDMLPGVIDIVERVANTGMGIYRASQVLA